MGRSEELGVGTSFFFSFPTVRYYNKTSFKFSKLGTSFLSYPALFIPAKLAGADGVMSAEGQLYNPALFAGIERPFDSTTYDSDILVRQPRHADLALITKVDVSETQLEARKDASLSVGTLPSRLPRMHFETRWGLNASLMREVFESVMET